MGKRIQPSTACMHRIQDYLFFVLNMISPKVLFSVFFFTSCKVFNYKHMVKDVDRSGGCLGQGKVRLKLMGYLEMIVSLMICQIKNT